MPNRWADGRKALAECDCCGFQYPLGRLRSLIVKTRDTNILVCPQCWTPDQPQLQLGMYPVDDPQAIQNPRPDTTYLQAGLTGLQILTVNPPDPTAVISFGTPSGGSRVIQWGWDPVGLNNPLQLWGLIDNLQATGAIGTVTVETT